ncbi:hypothetical protein C1T31_09085 [Hanstruepera neustonica]|uniref:Lipoprotein n=1 Tax=Hanstruepera neustonica TaxID=1445657 RepID=A0A2K1DYP8_9FLAO|nr:DUF6146 family protein [Hanstruepera neustonica]PNQ73131.1 hypothetical protein C1T31_09085 [Hanstruepera neustonica]
MKNLIIIFCIIIAIASCKSKDVSINAQEDISHASEKQDTIRIANDSIEYEVIIIEAGFDSWMLRRARPRSYYSKTFLEARNIQYVTEWNRRVVSSGFDRNLYLMQINYEQGIDYGFEVNYILYHYFVFFEEKYKQNLTVHNPRF